MVVSIVSILSRACCCSVCKGLLLCRVALSG